ncbi:PilT/PilU family type 4a pilus ATPase [Acetatifactor muris]|jgi:twitching motility protein PilT|uniref:Twitching mobility protein n=1 Tax=Acetatifactor muris TaxID=879566 RepID=A0A2K4ZDR6_9FIRM|nr:PilT/PilU family type 4a pilus ATPase [Acetatifactor muris]MCI8801579.1 PilT/PilU family type 4a pilus ATPase [Lachnospiraceae bacterium]MCR2046805.1 PilT/PilU family type 4a pilus ATPase [Acetatifactor muris]SOY28609.1 Twitching mobility protein [Acetatifactor muris]
MSVISAMLEEILHTAREAGASDVHLAAGLPPRMRVNGALVSMGYSRISPSDTLDMLIHVMPESQRSSFEEKGEYDFSFSVSNCGRCRANAYKQRGNVALALHLVDKEIPSPEVLGMPESVIRLHEKESGLVLVTGPSGSGRSATLAALVEQINENRNALVITLESPIEYIHQHKKSMINQREIGLDSRSYAAALDAALREDPDVILVGELRDAETVNAAVTAAETGHLVLSALHASNVVNAVESMIDLFPSYRQEGLRSRLADVLEAVVAQRLLPAGDRAGRAAAFEVLLACPEMRDAVRSGRTSLLQGVMRSGREQGMITMDESLNRLYTEGKIVPKT